MGDDSKMRCKYCAGETSDIEDNNFASKSNHKINCPMESQEPCLSPAVSRLDNVYNVRTAEHLYTFYNKVIALDNL